MRTKLPLPLVFLILAASLTAPPPAETRQGRNVGVGPSQAGASGYHALVIGNNEYKSLPRLKTAEADAREVAALLLESYGFETTLLLNATRAQIVSALSGYRRRLGPESSLLVYYAGHGFNDRDADKAYWLPVDAAADDTSNWIIADEITTALKVIAARHALVVSDSCYSGTLTRELPNLLPPPAAQRERFLQRMAAGKSRTLMASGGDEPVADGGGGRHSVFASALLRGLREMNEPRFTGAELFRQYVEEPVAGRAEQTPEYNPLRNSGHEAGDFVFARVRPGGDNAEATARPTQPAPAAAVDPAAIELSFWESIKTSTDAEDFKAYLDAYPAGRFAALARNNLRRLEAARAAQPPTGKTPTDRLPAGNAPTGNALTGNTPADPKAAARPTAGSTVRPRSGIELVYVPPGEFMMGSNGRRDEKPAHRVVIREGFYMGKYEVTQAQWRAVMGSDPPKSRFKGDNLPVDWTSWNDAQEFIQKLNAQNDGFIYRLPREAEWEYACRAGTTGAYAGTLSSMAWYSANSGDRTQPVGKKQANGFGLYDMHGNVWEWVQDNWHENYDGAPTDGSAWLSGDSFPVVRGGSWYNDAADLRVTIRDRNERAIRSIGNGFRVVAVARQ